MIDNIFTAAINRTRLNAGVKRYQSVVEDIFRTSLGDISLSAFTTYSNHIRYWYGIAHESYDPSDINSFAFVCSELANTKSNIIFHTKKKLFSPEDGLYLAVHEMAHLGHKLRLSEIYDKLPESHHELIVDMVAAYVTKDMNTEELHPTLQHWHHFSQKAIAAFGSFEDMISEELLYCSLFTYVEQKHPSVMKQLLETP